MADLPSASCRCGVCLYVCAFFCVVLFLLSHRSLARWLAVVLLRAVAQQPITQERYVSHSISSLASVCSPPILCFRYFVCDSGSGFCLNSWRLQVWEIDPVFGGFFVFWGCRFSARVSDFFLWMGTHQRKLGKSTFFFPLFLWSSKNMCFGVLGFLGKLLGWGVCVYVF